MIEGVMSKTILSPGKEQLVEHTGQTIAAVI